MPTAVAKIFSVTIVIDPSAGGANATGAGVSPVGLETLAVLARAGSKTRRALDGDGAVDDRKSRAPQGALRA